MSTFFRPGMREDPQVKRTEIGMQIYYVYRLDSNKRRIKGQPPIGTVALVFDSDGNVARGIAIRSANDQFCRPKGRQLAIARARHALYTRTSCDVVGIPVRTAGTCVDVRQAALDFMDVCRHNYDTIFDYKSQFNPKLTMFERGVVTDLWNSKHRAGLTAETDPFVAGLRAFVECRIRGDEIADAVTYSYRYVDDAAPKPATASETVNPATAGKSEQSPTKV